MTTALPSASDEQPPAVLVVEDELLIALMVTDILADAGYRPFWTRDGEGGPPSPRAAVVNLRLDGGLDGRNVVRRLRREHPSLPVVVLTGFGRHAPEADLRGLGGPTVRMHKPFAGDELQERLAAVLGGAPPPPAEAHHRRVSDGPAAPAAKPAPRDLRGERDVPGAHGA